MTIRKRGRPPRPKPAVPAAPKADPVVDAPPVPNSEFEALSDWPPQPAQQMPPEPAPTRPSMRPTMREEDPRTRAARRAEELREHLGDGDEGTDEFYIGTSIIPPGWAYEWKRKLTMGAEDPAYQVALRRAGWEHVPTTRHPELMPLDGVYPTIERKGMMLMERPLEINDEAHDRELRKARNQVRQKEAQLGAADLGQFERNNSGDPLVKIRKSYEHIPIPSE